jgi:hypothetical protein
METYQQQLAGLMALATGDEKHDPSAHSTLEVLWALYDRVLKYHPADPRRDDRDRFIMSKGHGPLALYAILAHKGFFPPPSCAGSCSGMVSSVVTPTATRCPASRRLPGRWGTASPWRSAWRWVSKPKGLGRAFTCSSAMENRTKARSGKLPCWRGIWASPT